MTARRHIPVLLLLALAAALAGCGRRPAEDAGAAGVPSAEALLAPTDVASAVRADLVAGLPVSGTLEPAVRVRITAPFPELIEQVRVREGQAVAKGQVLARLRSASVAPAAASADAALKSAAADYERTKNLFAAGAVAQRDVDAAEAQWRAAEAGAAQARKFLDDALVRTPVTGVVARRSVQAGDRVGDGDPMFEVVNTAELEFEATVPSEHVGRVTVGAPVRLTVTGYPEPVAGRIARVNAAADPATRQVRVYVVVPNPGRRLVGGLFASGRLVTGEANGVVVVPGPAVRGGADSTYVMVVGGGKLERRAVTLGLRDETRDAVEVRAGLAAGDSVVVGPIEGLSAGQRVRITGAGREG